MSSNDCRFLLSLCASWGDIGDKGDIGDMRDMGDVEENTGEDTGEGGKGGQENRGKDHRKKESTGHGTSACVCVGADRR